MRIDLANIGLANIDLARIDLVRHFFVQHPQFQRTRQLVQDGAIGRVEHVDVAFTYDNREDVTNIRNRPETGGGSIPDIGVYAFGSARFVTGAEPELDSLQSRIRFENGVDVYAQVTGRFNGPSGPFTYSSITSMRLFPRQEVVFQGETGLIRLTADGLTYLQSQFA
jgi:predicted dehydrogenase